MKRLFLLYAFFCFFLLTACDDSVDNNPELINKIADNGQDWSINIFTDGDNVASDLLIDNNGYLYLSGSTYGHFHDTFNIGGKDAFIQKLDVNGNLIWEKQFGSEDDDTALAMSMDENGSVFLFLKRFVWVNPYADPPGFNKFFVLKVTSSGDSLWTTYVDEAYESYASSILYDSQNNLYVGFYNDAKDSSFIYKIGSEGKMLNKFVFEKGSTVSKFFKTSNNDFIFLRRVQRTVYYNKSSDYPAYDISFLKMDSSYKIKKERVFKTQLDEFFYRVRQDKFGNIYLLGEADDDWKYSVLLYDYKEYSSQKYPFMMKMDSEGNNVWRNIYSNSFPYYFLYDISFDSKGNAYVLAYKYDSDDSYSVIVRLDNYGEIAAEMKIEADENSSFYKIKISEDDVAYIIGSIEKTSENSYENRDEIILKKIILKNTELMP